MKQDISKVKKSAQEMQDEIFKKMPAGKKIELTLALTKLCLDLNRLNDRTNRSKKITY